MSAQVSTKIAGRAPWRRHPRGVEFDASITCSVRPSAVPIATAETTARRAVRRPLTSGARRVVRVTRRQFRDIDGVAPVAFGP